MAGPDRSDGAPDGTGEVAVVTGVYRIAARAVGGAGYAKIGSWEHRPDVQRA